jgi:hypothetical protein
MYFPIHCIFKLHVTPPGLTKINLQNCYKHVVPMGLDCIKSYQLNWNVPSEHNVYNNVVAKLIIRNCKCSIGAECL